MALANMILDELQTIINVILMELDIRIQKLKELEDKEESPEKKDIHRIRRYEFENLRIWIEIRMKYYRDHINNVSNEDLKKIALFMNNMNEENESEKFFDKQIEENFPGTFEHILADERQIIFLIKSFFGFQEN